MPHKISFRVVSISSQDENFPALELNQHSPSTKGWLSARFSSFPQQITIELEERSSLRKIQILSHQCMIASKIEIFVGDIPENDLRDFRNARYVRLGYVVLSNNAKNEFKARELKSVHTDAVGVVAINIIGTKSIAFSKGTTDSEVISMNPEYIPPTEDLAFDMYQDPEVANIIRRLEKHKYVSVKAERFDQAQNIRDAITQLQQVGERLGRLSIEKQQAVEEENYAAAKLKKEEMHDIRVNLYRDIDLVNLLKEAPILDHTGASKTSFQGMYAHPGHSVVNRLPPIHLQSLEGLDNPINGHPLVANEVQHTNSNTNGNTHPRYHSFSYSSIHPDERPLPALKNRHHSIHSTDILDLNKQALVTINDSAEKPKDDVDYQQSVEQPELDSVESSHHYELPVDAHLVNEPLIEVNNEMIDAIDDERRMSVLESQGDDRHFHSPHHHHHHHLHEHVTDNMFGQSTPVVPEVPEPMSETNRRQAGASIDVVGINMVTKIYSKSWTFREKALMELHDRVTAPKLPPPVSVPDNLYADPKAELKSSTFILRRALNDQVLSIFRLATGFIKPIIMEFADRHAIPRPDLHYALDKLIPILFQRTGDTSPRLREVAKMKLCEMAKWPQIRQNAVFWSSLLRSLAPVTLDRLALSRMELVSELYAAHGLDPNLVEHNSAQTTSSFTLDAVTAFTVQALNHRSNEVREMAEHLMITLYRHEDRNVMRRYLPVDEIHIRRQPLYRRLFAKFDEMDGIYPSAVVDKELNQVYSANKRKEVEALHADVYQLRKMVGGDHHRSHTTRRSSPTRQIGPKATSKLKSRKPHGASSLSPSKRRNVIDHKQNRPMSNHMDNAAHHQELEGAAKLPADSMDVNQLTEEAELLLSLDKTCIFCGEHNDQFTEEGLDMHYWKNCPMLHRCPNCKQVVEIAGLTEHLLEECELSPAGHYTRCPHCTEAVVCTQLESHTCIPVKIQGGMRCSLCHQDLPLLSDTVAPNGPEDIWKAHLLGFELIKEIPLCTENQRQLKKTTRLSNTILKNGTNNNSKTKSGIPRPANTSKVRPV